MINRTRARGATIYTAHRVWRLPWLHMPAFLRAAGAPRDDSVSSVDSRPRIDCTCIVVPLDEARLDFTRYSVYDLYMWAVDNLQEAIPGRISRLGLQRNPTSCRSHTDTRSGGIYCLEC